jgi:RIO-like serine/threonine protein kinase
MEGEGEGEEHWGKRATVYRTVVIKVFKSVGKYDKEYDVYSRMLPYVPKLIAYDKRKLALKIERVGESCKGMSNGLSHSIMEELGERLRQDTGIHHGDIAPVNVCYDGDKYFLIDFEKCKYDMRDVVCTPGICGCYKHKK